jgi:hypothetical protein
VLREKIISEEVGNVGGALIARAINADEPLLGKPTRVEKLLRKKDGGNPGLWAKHADLCG